MGAAVLVLSYSVIGLVVADHVLKRFGLRSAQSETRPARRLMDLLLHAVVVLLSLSPIMLLYGLPGVLYAATLGLAHLAIDGLGFAIASDVEDRLVTRRAGSGAYDLSAAAIWVPVRTLRLVLETGGHLAVIFGAWWLWLASERAIPALVALITEGRDIAVLSAIATGSLVLVALILVNAYIGLRFVVSIVPPLPRTPAQASATPQDQDLISAIVGIIERVTVALLVVGHAEEAAALLLAAKEISRRLRVERETRFAEHYLVGTLASFGFAVLTGYLARFALAAGA